MVLLANAALAALTGAIFWVIVLRWGRVSSEEVGTAYTVIAAGTALAIIAKGGLDTALVQSAAVANLRTSRRLAMVAAATASMVAIVLLLAIAGLDHALPIVLVPRSLSAPWVFAVALLLELLWLQDAYFLGTATVRHSFVRNLVLSASRLAFPIALIRSNAPHPILLSWMLAVTVSVAAGFWFSTRTPARAGRDVGLREFLLRSGRHIGGNSAEFLPGLLLAPLVLRLEGEENAAYFGMAWTVASLLFLGSAAVSRSALAEFSQTRTDVGHAVRRGVLQHLFGVFPFAGLVAVAAPIILFAFGATYTQRGLVPLWILLASVPFVAALYLYFALLRARDAALPLIVFPLVLVLGIYLTAPILAARWGIAGIAAAWFIVNAPLGTYAALRLKKKRIYRPWSHEG
jgi:O-antigen/teichoic acid export membrane protein